MLNSVLCVGVWSFDAPDGPTAGRRPIASDSGWFSIESTARHSDVVEQ